ncbi:hypothetical protein ACFW2E_43225, partial [Streptomyces sp. NPDC058964]
ITPDLTVRIVRTRGERLGGDDWDAAVAAELRGRLPEGTDPRPVAERLRRGLAEADIATEPVTDAAGEPYRVTLERAALERAVAPLRARALAAVAEELAESGADAVLLAGGLCATPGRRAEIEDLPEARGLTVRCTSPELAVVRGLLALEDFGALRIGSGPAPHSSAAGFPAPDPTPPAFAEDPEPGFWRSAAEEPGAHAAHLAAADPEPRARHSPSGDPPPSADRADRASEAATPRNEPDPQPPPFRDTAGPGDPPTAGPVADGASGLSPDPGPGPEPEPEQPSYVPPPTGTTAPAADPRLRSVPVDQLQAIRRGDHLLVLWAWPETALSARVRWRREGTVTDGGPANGDLRCQRRVYEHDGGLDLPVGRGAVTLTVEALVPDPDVDCEGASSLRVAAEPPVVEYEPAVRRRLKGRVATVTFTSATDCELPGLRIVHGVGRYRPTSTAEGTVLHEVPPQRLPAGTPLTVEFPLPGTRGPSWLVCFPADGNSGTGTSLDASSDGDIDIRPTALHRLRVT